MSEEIKNVEIIPEFKMYITDLETERDSKEIDVSDLIFNDYIEFEFGNYEDEDYETLTYKDFKFFINDYSITIYSPQMEELQNQLQQKENGFYKREEFLMNNIKRLEQKVVEKENIIKEVREYIEHYETIRGYYEYEEDGYDEYNYEEDLKQELLEILGGENNA